MGRPRPRVAGQHRARGNARIPRPDAAQSAPGVAHAAGPGVEVDEPLAEAPLELQAEAQDPRVQDPARPRWVGALGTCVERVVGVALSGEGGEEVGVIDDGVRGGGRGEAGMGKLLGSRRGRVAEQGCGSGTHVRTADAAAACAV
jgi:hypothetical protein